MALILPTTWPCAGSTSLARVTPGLATLPPVPDDGDHYDPEDHETRGHQEQGDVLGRLASQVRVEESLGEDAEGRGRDEVPESHLGEPCGKGDGVEGYAWQEASDEHGIRSPPREPAVGRLEPRLTDEHLHGDPAQGA